MSMLGRFVYAGRATAPRAVGRLRQPVERTQLRTSPTIRNGAPNGRQAEPTRRRARPLAAVAPCRKQPAFRSRGPTARWGGGEARNSDRRVVASGIVARFGTARCCPSTRTPRTRGLGLTTTRRRRAAHIDRPPRDHAERDAYRSRPVGRTARWYPAPGKNGSRLTPRQHEDRRGSPPGGGCSPARRQVGHGQ